jgi:hypothetical protein
MQFNILILDI